MKKEKFMRRFFVSKIFLLISAVIFGFLLFVLSKKILEGREISQEIKTTEEEITRLESKNSELSELFSYLNTNEFLEQEAREKFNLQKEGESVMVVPESTKKDNGKQIAAASEDEVGRRSNPSRWWNYFFNQ
jgi:cell division protein FtsB